MAKFIEVHQKGEPILLNLDAVAGICSSHNCTFVNFTHRVPNEQNFVEVDESYDDLRRLIYWRNKQ